MVEISTKHRKVLSNSIWYHGTTYKYWNSFCKKGIVVEYNKDTSDALDFGYGFYLAPSRERAETYIKGMMENSRLYAEDDQPMILGFEFTPLEWFEGEKYKTKIFGKFDDEFAKFVFENRTKNIVGAGQHNYDVIYGVMSDSVPTLLIQEYKLGLKNEEEVLEALKKSTSMKQISLHNQSLCDTITLSEAYIFDKKTGEREELSLDDYCK